MGISESCSRLDTPDISGTGPQARILRRRESICLRLGGSWEEIL